MSYQKQNWKHDTQTTEEMFNHMETGIDEAHKLLEKMGVDLSKMESTQVEQSHVIKRMMLDMYINDRDIVGGNGLIHDTFDGMPPKNIELDMAQTHLIEEVAAGVTNLPIDSISGFEVGQEITVYDDLNMEDVMVTAIATDSIAVSALINGYKRGATVSRSSVLTGDGKLECGAWGTNSVIAEVV